MYLTIDRDLQVGLYSLIEQSLAGILINKITPDLNYKVTEDTDESSMMIPVKDAYFQFINNNMLNMDAFASGSQLEQSIYARFEERKASVIRSLPPTSPTPGLRPSTSAARPCRIIRTMSTTTCGTAAFL